MRLLRFCLAGTSGLYILAGCGSDPSSPPADGSGLSDAAARDAGSNAASCAPGVVACSCAALPSTCGANHADSCCTSLDIPGGVFLRGFDASNVRPGFPDSPASVSAFRLDRYEVTVGRFRAFVEAGEGTQLRPPAVGAGAHVHLSSSGWDARWNIQLPADTRQQLSRLRCDATFHTWTDDPGVNEDQPINCVSWYEALAFCIWDGGYLPSEAEWNYAAAGGEEQRAYPWSVPAGLLAIDGTRASFWTEPGGCIGDADPDCTSADLVNVGGRPAGDGRWGQSDLAGNVDEWTFDLQAKYALPCTDCINLSAGFNHVVRGGSCADNSDSLRTHARRGHEGFIRNWLTGLRCARAL
jgi:formylglycine-generating enzyme required for sulfatase activity